MVLASARKIKERGWTFVQTAVSGQVSELKPVEGSNKTFIPAKPKVDLYGDGHMFRVCAYCRVSTDNDEQLSSFELQQAHYQQLAQNHPNWSLRHIYADKGISGTSLKNRDEFNAMIEACRHGEYDLIVTKSVSRFARNLVDCISLIRMLKGLTPPVGVYFETDNLYTLSENTEFMLSFLATFAQEESVKKSEAMNWSLKQRFKDGKLLTPSLLGYDRPKDVTGRYIKYAPLEINQKEAGIVRFIFDAYIAGWPCQQIALLLTHIVCETKSGSTEWSAGSIRYILTNERYCGDVLTWKTFTADLYEHKHKRNRQDRDQYLYKNRHEAIISVEQFEAVQTLMENNKHHVRGGLPLMYVINEGIFQGFVPINHHWINDDPNSYYDASNSVKDTRKTHKILKKEFSAFDLKGYQVVRGQFMQLRYEGPSITISNEKLSFNKFCVQRFEDVAYIQLLLHPTERRMAIRPCAPDDPHSIRWRPDPEKPISQKMLCCSHFGSALFRIMEWHPDYRYRIRGTWVCRGNEQIIVFNLPNAMPMLTVPKSDASGTTSHRVQLCPEEWEDDFGAEFYDHTLDNGFYYIAPNSEWRSQAQSVLASHPQSYMSKSDEQLQMSIDLLRREMRDGEDGN